MTTVIDTSLLLSLAMDDEHSEEAEKWRHENPGLVWVPELAAFEARNALRSFGLRGVLPGERLENAKRALEALLRWEFEIRSFRPKLLIAEAERLLNHFSPGTPHGAMEVLHVAAAKLSHAARFGGFDANQRKLAESAGLEVVP